MISNKESEEEILQDLNHKSEIRKPNPISMTSVIAPLLFSSVFSSLLMEIRSQNVKTVLASTKKFIADEATTLAAAVSFYTALSFAPLIVVTLWITSFLGTGTQERLVQELVGLTGPQVGEVVRVIIENAKEQPSIGAIAGWVSIVMVLISASGVFGELQSSFNKIWEVKPDPSKSTWQWLRKRVLSMGMVISLGFVMMVSMIVSAVISVFASYFGGALQGMAIQLGNTLASLVVFTLMFAALFRLLPDVKIPWREVWFGASITSVLFVLGKYLIGLYLAHSSIGSAYGAAGSLVLLLVWVYYSTIILFFGAEITRVHYINAPRANTEDQRPFPDGALAFF